MHLGCERGDLASTNIVLEFLAKDEQNLAEVLYIENKAGEKPLDLAARG